MNAIIIQAFSRALEKYAQGIDPETIGMLLGAGTGGYLGHKLTKDPAKKTNRAILGAILGGLGGSAAGGALFPAVQRTGGARRVFGKYDNAGWRSGNKPAEEGLRQILAKYAPSSRPSEGGLRQILAKYDPSRWHSGRVAQ